MIHQLKAPEFGKVQSLFNIMDYHLAPQAILVGSAQGVVYVDDPSDPRSAIAQTGHRFYLVGFERNDAFNEGLKSLFIEQIYPQALEAGQEDFVLYYAPGGWEREIDEMLKDKFPAQIQRQYYAFKELRDDWRALIPPGFTVQPVDGELLQAERLKNVNNLLQEVLSECASVEEYVRHRFGFCTISKGEIVGWCLSEYNWKDRCEVGIETVGEYRRRGIATITASTLIDHAVAKGVTRIGWHCYVTNEPSIATARKVGFEKVRDYPVYYAWFEKVANLAVNGNICLQQKRYREAVVWYERAFNTGEAPVWAYVNAARANALVGEREAALRCLRQAVEKGFTDLDYIKSLQQLKSLHEMQGWRALIDGLERKMSSGAKM